MEKKLKEYRAQQERLDRLNRIRDNLKTIFSFIKLNGINRRKILTEGNTENKKPSSSTRTTLSKISGMDKSDEDQYLIMSEDESIDIEDDSIWCCSWLQVLYYSLYLILWGTVYAIFIKLEFGTVYLISSGLILMYLNTRTTPRKSGEISAYSVFNKGCVSIDGTLKAEQFEREIMFGAGSVR